jgi:hypothetical protein
LAIPCRFESGFALRLLEEFKLLTAIASDQRFSRTSFRVSPARSSDDGFSEIALRRQSQLTPEEFLPYIFQFDELRVLVNQRSLSDHCGRTDPRIRQRQPAARFEICRRFENFRLARHPPHPQRVYESERVSSRLFPLFSPDPVEKFHPTHEGNEQCRSTSAGSHDERFYAVGAGLVSSKS